MNAIEPSQTYLLLNLGTLLLPLLLSFDSRVQFYKDFKYLVPAILAPAGWFILWDVQFTAQGVWGFNDAYISGGRIAGLPVEEWLFFLTIPYATVFIYATLQVYFPQPVTENSARSVSMFLIVVLGTIALLFTEKAYTSWTFGLLSLALLIQFAFGHRGKLLLLYRAWLVALLPFAVVNGVLTALPVVWYNDAENLALRLGTIPVEDVFYGFLLFFLNVNLFEYLRTNRPY